MEHTCIHIICSVLFLVIAFNVKQTKTGYSTHESVCGHCGPETFACGNGVDPYNGSGISNGYVNCTCIPIKWRCDGDIDCINDSSDEIGCAIQVCSGEHFTCSSGKCILKSWWCDGDNDCNDGSDEDDCAPRECITEREFKCANDRCIKLEWHCDGSDDCGDGSDEECPGRPCAASEFRCHSGGCISLSWHCDHDSDCTDGSDELDCDLIPIDHVTCPTGHHRCRNGRCISEAYHCDGDNDCGDWSDEEKCECLILTDPIGNNCKCLHDYCYCSSEGRVECRNGEYRCTDGQCINLDWKCDGDTDCDDRSDEINCPLKSCTAEEFRCRTGRCVRLSWRCDGDFDCSDNSDEDGCGSRLECTTGNYRCGDGTCISQHYVCNGAPNCPDGSDEDANGTCASVTPCREDGFPCQHLCIATVNGHHCACKEGYQMGLDGRSCIDIDECALKELICSQKCENSVPGFQCFCSKGYRMRADKRRCKALGPEPMIIFANRQDIRRVSLDKSEYIAILSHLQNAIALDYHYQYDLIFWSDITVDAIFSASLNGSDSMSIVNAGLISPGGITVDWIGNRIFWTDSGTSRIEFSNLDGSMRKVLFWKSLEKPRAIVANPEESVIFWTDWGQQPRIEKAFMDGTGRRMVIETSLFWPNGLTIDHPSKRIYWVDAKHHVIENANWDGTDRRRVIEGDLPHPFAVTIFEDNIYWTDWHTKSIHTASKLTGRNISVVHTKLHFPMDITILHPLRQPDVNDRCAGHGCSHICLPNNVSYRCTCPTGFHLSNDGKLCNDQPEAFLLFTRRNDIRWLCIDCPDDANIDVVLPLKNINSAVSIDYDRQTSAIFWSDVSNKSINSGYWNGSKQDIVVSRSLESPAGLAVDWSARNLYWVDAGRNVIEVSRIDGSYRSIIVWQSLDQPRDIVLDPPSALMFWSQWDHSNAKIERSGMDGSDRLVLHTYNISWPYGLAIDSNNKRLYWSDAGMKRIEYSDFSGSGRRILITRNIKHPYGLVVFEDHVYWTDLELKSIQRAHKMSGDHRKALIEGLENLMDIQIYNNKKNITSLVQTNACTNAGCSHICLLSPSELGYRCTCPTGVKLLDDHKTCANDMQRYLIVATRTAIRRISLQVPYFAEVVVPIEKKLSNAIIIDVHPQFGTVFWSDTKDDKIYSSSFDGKSVKTVISVGLDDVNGLAIDNIGNKIYWTDAGRKRIEVSNLDGSMRKVLVWNDLDSPRGIAVHYASGYMIWADWGSVVRIERADMDGGRRAVIISDKLGWPNGITVMSSAGRIVWCDSQTHTIEMADLNGANRKQIIGDLSAPYGIAVIDNYVYWTDWDTRAVHRLFLDGSRNKPETIISLNNLVDLRAVSDHPQDLHITHNMCQINNGGCSHLCLRNSAKGYSCHCPTGMILYSDDKTCNSNMTKFLLIASKASIRRISLDTSDYSDVYLPIDDVQNVVAIDYDYSNKQIYYTDTSLKVIRSANFNGDNSINVIEKDLTAPNGIAFDWIAKNIYWTDADRNVIEVSRYDGTSRKILIDLDLDEPRALSLIPAKGIMFWGDSGVVPKIERAYLDGSNRRVIISTALGWPNGIAIDELGERIFWADAQLDRIESSDIDGRYRSMIIKEISHPYGITLLDAHIFWSDRQTKAIERANKVTGNDHETITDNIEYLMEIKIVAPERQTGMNPCGIHNGGCTHLCLFRPHGYICVCPSYHDSLPCSTVPGEVIPDLSGIKSISSHDKTNVPKLSGDTSSTIEPPNHINDTTICKDQMPNCSTPNLSLNDYLIHASYVIVFITITLVILILLCTTIVYFRRKSVINSNRNEPNNSLQYANASSMREKDSNIIISMVTSKSDKNCYTDKHQFGDNSEEHTYIPPPPPPPSNASFNRRLKENAFLSPQSSGHWQRMNVTSPIHLQNVTQNQSLRSIETDI